MLQLNGVNPRSRESIIDQQFAAARPSQPSSISRCARIATPIVGLLVAGAGAYALASGVNRNNYDQTDTYHLNLVNGLSGAAGAVGGALVSWLADTAVRTYCCVRDRAVQPLPRQTGAELFRRDLQAESPVEANDWEDPASELEPGQQPGRVDERDSKNLEVGHEPDQRLAEKDFTTAKPVVSDVHQAQAAKKAPTGGVKLPESVEVGYWIGVSRELRAEQVAGKKS